MSKELFNCDQLCDPANGACLLKSVLEKTIVTLKDATNLPLDAQELIAQESKQLQSYGCRAVGLAIAMESLRDATTE